MIAPGLLVAFTLASPNPGADPGEGGPAAGLSAGTVRSDGIVDGGGVSEELDPAAAAILAELGPEKVERLGLSPEDPAFSGLLLAFAERAADAGDFRAGEGTALPAEGPGEVETIDLAGMVFARAALAERPQVPPTTGTAGTGAEGVAAPPLDSGLLNGLSGGFVSRLQRVADRMWVEHGLRVEVVEGFRTQGRQNALFTRGRTAPGPVVTWTRNSLHTAGLAADLYVDGGPVTQGDALVLARIAREEGLQTLYPLDSGHIQMNRPGAERSPEAALERVVSPGGEAGASAPPRRGVAPVAPVAPVAQPARPPGVVSRTAGEAPPAAGPESAAMAVASTGLERPRLTVEGAPSAGHEGSTGPLEPVTESPDAARRTAIAERIAVVASISRPAVAVTPPVRGNGPRASGEPGAGVSEPRGREEGGARGTPSGEGVAPARGEAAPAIASATPARPVEAVHRPSGPTGPAGVDPAVFEAASQQPAYRRLHIPLDGVEGATSLQVGMRGGAVDARVNVSDPLLAGDLRGRLHELRQQLASRGLEAGDVSVRVVPEAAAETTARVAGGSESRGLGQGGSGAAHQGRAGRSDDGAEESEGRPPRQEGDEEDVT